MSLSDAAPRNGQPDMCQMCVQAPADVFRYFVGKGEVADRHAVGADDLFALCFDCYDTTTYIRIAKKLGPKVGDPLLELLKNLVRDSNKERDE